MTAHPELSEVTGMRSRPKCHESLSFSYPPAGVYGAVCLSGQLLFIGRPFSSRWQSRM